MWRRNILKKFIADKTLEETTILQKLAQTKSIKIAKVPNVGIYHYYSDSVMDYFKKRKKIAGKFLERKKQKNTWVDTRSNLKKIISVLYLISFFGPLLEGLYMIVKSKRSEWLWHPFISFITIVVYGTYFVKDKFRRST